MPDGYTDNTNILITGRTGTQHVTAAHDALIYRSILGSTDFILNEGNKFECNLDGMTHVNVLNGFCVMQGRLVGFRSTDVAGGYIPLTLAEGSASYNRIDNIVIEYPEPTREQSQSQNIEYILESAKLKVVQGYPAATGTDPEAPVVQNGSIDRGQVHQILLYRAIFNGTYVYLADCRNFLPDNILGKRMYRATATLTGTNITNQAFSPVDISGNSFVARDDQLIELYLNGLKLVEGTEFTATVNESNEHQIDVTFTTPLANASGELAELVVR